MRDSAIKDIILSNALSAEDFLTSQFIFDHYKIPLHSIETMMDEMIAEGHIHKITAEGGLSIILATKKGAHFHDKTSYRKQAFWKDVENMPKKYWFVMILIASLGFNAKDAINYFAQKKSLPPKTEQVKDTKISDTSHRK